MTHNFPYFSDCIFYYFLEALLTMLQPQWPAFLDYTKYALAPGLCTAIFSIYSNGYSYHFFLKHA